MKIKWEDIQKIAERNALFLEEVPEDFLSTDVSMTEDELVTLLWLMLDDFETEDGRIKKNRKNFFLVNRVDQLFKTFALAGGLMLMSKLIKKFQKIVSNNAGYYQGILGSTERFSKIKTFVTDLVNRRLGVNNDGSMKTGGYMSDLANMTTVRNEIRELIYKNVLAEAKITDLRKVLQGFIVGDKDTKGIVYKFYSKFAYDSFSQIDRMASAQFASEFNLTQFIYAGIIIKNSRAFCRKKINGIYTIAEGMKWPYESPAPIGISTATYNPAIDMGGINCKHVPLFITREIADDLLNRGFSTAPSNL